MSHPLVTAAHGDRREGGRHGKPGGRSGSLSTAPIRIQLLRLTVLPAAAVTLCAWTAVLCAVRAAPGSPGAGSWAVIAGSAVLPLAILAVAAVAACRTAGTLRNHIVGLRRHTAGRQSELRALVESLRDGETPPPARTPELPGRSAGKDELGLLALEMSRAHDAAVAAVMQAARMPRRAGGGPQDRAPGLIPMAHVIDVFVNLARRLQSLVHREISLLDELENEIEDPDLLKCLFHVDHLATRMRRHAENLAVLGGAAARRQWSRPVPVTDVLRSAMAEVEQYPRIRLVPPTDGTVRGHAVADVVHLLAELIENATVFSAPHTPVLLRVAAVTSGLAVEVEDRGPGMPAHEQARMNMLLSDPVRVDVGLLRDGRIGLYVVSQLARRHGVSVCLQTNIYGGTQAVLVLPKSLLGSDEDAPAASGPGLRTEAGPPVPAGPRLATGPAGAARPGALSESRGGPAHGRTGGGPTGRAREHTAEVPACGPTTRAPEPAASPAPAAWPATAPAPAASPQPGVALVNGPGAASAGVAPPAPASASGAQPEPAAPDAPPAARGRRPGRPRLPTRQAQQHIVPQLREGPAARQDPARAHGDEFTGHTPDLMAAFRRGFDLAEAQKEPGAASGREVGARHNGD